jgi:uncharacterized delta-60 repeat protein
MTISRRTVAFASALAVGCACGAALAKPGPTGTSKRLALDPAFGDHGVAAFTNLGTQSIDRFDAIATDWMARHLYVAGRGARAAVARFDLRGAPDPTFGVGGVAVLPVDGYANGILALGGIVLYGSFDPPAGSSLPSGAARVLADGSGLDPAFGAGGLLSLDSIPTGGRPAALRSAAQSPVDGSYVASVLWGTGLADAAGGLIRFSKDGVIDGSFGGDGLVELELGSALDTTRDVAIDSVGRTIVALDASIQRFNADGSRDTTFGTDGVLRDSDGGGAIPIRLAIADGDAVVAVVNRARRGGYALRRWMPDGSLDESFGRAGRIDLPLRYRGGIVVPDAIALVPTFDGVPLGDRVFVAGGAVFGRDTDRRQRGGWFGELVDESRPRLVRTFAQRGLHPWADEQLSVSDVVCTSGRAFAVGNRSARTTGGERIESPFLVSFDLDR